MGACGFTSPPGLSHPPSPSSTLTSSISKRNVYIPHRNNKLQQQPRALLLSPLPTLTVITLLSTNYRIPSSIRNAPTAFILSSILSNINLLPYSSSVYSSILDLAPQAIALLLLATPSSSSSPSKLHTLILPFMIGALGTVVSALIVPFMLSGIGIDIGGIDKHIFASLLAAFTATYIGGSLNFLGIVNLLSIPKQMAATAIAIDMAVMAIYFAVLFSLSARSRAINKNNNRNSNNSNNNNNNVITSFSIKSILSSIIPISLSFFIVKVSEIIMTKLNLPGTLTLILSSTLAYMFPKSLISPSSKIIPFISTLSLSFFFASLGATSNISLITSSSSSLIILLSAIFIIIGHAFILYIVGVKVFNISLPRLLIASNCNIGGATTAPAYAAASGWNSYIPAAVAAGTLGYVIATPMALLLYKVIIAVLFK